MCRALSVSLALPLQMALVVARLVMYVGVPLRAFRNSFIHDPMILLTPHV